MERSSAPLDGRTTTDHNRPQRTYLDELARLASEEGVLLQHAPHQAVVGGALARDGGLLSSECLLVLVDVGDEHHARKDLTVGWWGGEVAGYCEIFAGFVVGLYQSSPPASRPSRTFARTPRSWCCRSSVSPLLLPRRASTLSSAASLISLALST